MTRLSLYSVVFGLIFSAGVDARRSVRPAGNHECYESENGYFFKRDYKACQGKNVNKTIVKKPSPKMCLCPCATK